MKRTYKHNGLASIAVAGFALVLAGCGGSEPTGAPGTEPTSAASSAASTPTEAATQFGAACASVPKTGSGSFSGMAKDPVATAASNNPALSTLVTAVTKAGLVDTLNNAKDITVFAPANSAFAKVPPATMNKAMGDPKGLLAKVLTNHVVPGKLSPDKLAGTHKTLSGGSVEVTGSGETFKVNGVANVVCGNVQTANATVYIIDAVLLTGASGGAAPANFGPACASVPKSGSGSFSGMAKDPVATAASNNPALSTLVTAVTKAGLGDTLNNAKDITVFAPANSAFAKVPKATMNKAMADPKGLLAKVLTNHVVPGKLSPDKLAGTHKTLSGGTIKVTGSGTSFTVDGTAKVVCGNVMTANATVYIIDGVLLPKS